MRVASLIIFPGLCQAAQLYVMMAKILILLHTCKQTATYFRWRQCHAMPTAHSRPPPQFCKQTWPMHPRPPGIGPTAAKSLAASHLQKPEASARNTCRLATRNGPYGNAKTAVLPANTTSEGATPQKGRHYASIAQPDATAAAQWRRASHTHKKRHGRKRPPKQDRAGNGPSTDKLPCKTQQP